MSLAQIIKWLHPDARPNIDWVVRDDGEGPFIHRWDDTAIGAPEPTVDEVLAHEDEWRLDTARRAKIEAIDARSHELLTAGLDVDEGTLISTSLEAQSNLVQLIIGVQSGLTTLPQGISTIDGGEYQIADGTDLMRVAGLWGSRKKEILDAGRALRLAVLAAETVEAVEAITDDRE